MTAVVPAANLAAAGSGAVTVTPTASGTATNALVFTVGTPTLQVTSLSFSGGNGTNIQALVTVTNKSGFQLTGAQLTSVTLVTTNARMAATGLPAFLTPPTLAGQGSGTVTLTFPSSSSLSLSSVRGIQFAGAYTGGTFSGSAAATQ